MMTEHLGFDLLAHLENLRDRGVTNINVDEYGKASQAALKSWEDCNYPYRLPEDLHAFLSSSDGFFLSWTAKPFGPKSSEIVVGRVQVNRLSAIKRVALDSDEVLRITSVASTLASGVRASSDPGMGTGQNNMSPPDGFSGGNIRRMGISSAEALDANSSAYGIAAFSLDAACEVGRIALVYGAPSSASFPRPRNSRETGRIPGSLKTPGVWLQDMSCRWHFLADSFTSYFRMMVVHLGIRGWQQAFSAIGLSPATEKCMRLYCPDRLLFDKLEWQKERAGIKAAKDAAHDKDVEDQEKA